MENSSLEILIKKVTYTDVTEAMILSRKKIAKIASNITHESLLNTINKRTNFISPDFCNWIVYESELYAENNGGWTKKRHKNYPTTDLPVREIPALNTPLFNMTIMDIFPIISEHYKLNKYFLQINDLFVVKYDVNGQDHLGFHRDGSIISFNILLNDDFEGGGTIIKHISEDGMIDERIHTSEKGSLFIHSGKLLHSGRKITSGRRYILVGFIEYSFDTFKAVMNGEEFRDTKYSSFNNTKSSDNQEGRI